MNQSEIDAIAKAVTDRIAPPDVLSAKDAAIFLRMTDDQFWHWRRRHKVPMCAFGRYSLRALKAGLEREARQTYQPAKPDATAP